MDNLLDLAPVSLRSPTRAPALPAFPATAPHARSPPTPALPLPASPNAPLGDIANYSLPTPPSLIADERISSSSRAADPISSMLDVRKAAALSLPQKRKRNPAKQNVLEPSPFRPHVSADQRVLLWTSPHSLKVHSAMQRAGNSIQLQRRIYEGLLMTHDPANLESDGAGLLRFHQFSDREGIPESARMPADNHLLAAFVADATGSESGETIRNWLNDLRLWHLFNDAPWHGDEGWLPMLIKSADKAGARFERPPITPANA
ncbi:hypothetical protein B0H19DRAFT_699374 [Mycena capillaripes]|nr:hypothetical protein B0H19DRAFT_699374 [Mycena capillaripes]